MTGQHLAALASAIILSVLSIYQYQRAEFWEAEAKRYQSGSATSQHTPRQVFGIIDDASQKLDRIGEQIDRDRIALRSCLDDLKNANRMLLDHARSHTDTPILGDEQ